MKLFGKKKRYSSLRFCTKAVELPLLHLKVLTVAVSHISEARLFPESSTRIEGYAQGLVHSWGINTPVLPVEIGFDFYSPQDGPLASGGMDMWTTADEQHYVLRIGIADRSRSIFNALRKAMEAAAISQQRFYHVDFRNDHLGRRSKAEGKTDTSPWGKDHDERRTMLKAVDEGKAGLPDLEFDQIFFRDSITTRAPSWTWRWGDRSEENPEQYHDVKAARGRQWHSMPPMPDTD